MGLFGAVFSSISVGGAISSIVVRRGLNRTHNQPDFGASISPVYSTPMTLLSRACHMPCTTEA